MKIAEYQAAAARTANASQPYHTRRVVALLGLVGESGEVADEVKKIVGHGHPADRAKLVKEAGDVFWYLAENLTLGEQSFADDLAEAETFAELREKFRANPDRPKILSAHDLGMAALTSAVLFADSCKTRDMVDLLAGLMCLDAILDYFGITLDEVAEKNIEKLKARYPEGFSEEASRNRVEEAAPFDDGPILSFLHAVDDGFEPTKEGYWQMRFWLDELRNAGVPDFDDKIERLSKYVLMYELAYGKPEARR